MNSDEPAFPQSSVSINELGACVSGARGLTKRELFAAMAMQGFLSCPESYRESGALTSACVDLADSLLDALAKEKP